MKFKKISAIALICLGATFAAHANEVLLTANQPMKITFRVAHKNQNGQPVLGNLQSVNVDKSVRVSVPLDTYDRAGIVIVSADNQTLPPSANQFDQPEQCSMTTDKTKTSGTVDFIQSDHAISCRVFGGVFG